MPCRTRETKAPRRFPTGASLEPRPNAAVRAQASGRERSTVDFVESRSKSEPSGPPLTGGLLAGRSSKVTG
ncbi:hypothetical protein EYF80_066808 [Liparis tanakae]|uniref:Uncharacterized protein n=1 Tax=Liparis tanakae TaxID=230148 RepID=A0A4Z2E2R4_9TELE|nr:hypothetical protein EYF80_066808 [Liparis tanakae]